MPDVLQDYAPGITPELEPFFDALMAAIATQASKLTKDSNQAVGGTSYESLTFSDTDFDEGTLADLSNDRVLLSAGDDGIYLIRVSVLSDAGSGTEDVRIQVNGSTVAERTGLTAAEPHVVEALERLQAGDTVTVDVKQSSGSGNWLSDQDTYLSLMQV